MADATARWKSLSPQVRFQHRDFFLLLADYLGSVRDNARSLALALDQVLDRTRGRDPEVISAATLDLVRVLTLDLIRLRVRVQIVSRDRDRVLDLSRELAGAIDRARAVEFVLLSDPAPDRGYRRVIARDLGRARELARDFGEGCANVTDAASDFVGADLSAVDPGQVGLAGIRWDEDTRWVSREWRDRVRRASVERPAGSGVFTVLSEDEHASAELALG